MRKGLSNFYPLLCLELLFITLLASCKPAGAKNEVVVYTSVDYAYAAPITQSFEQQSGIHVRLVTDTEETKSSGLLERLLSEKKRPQADVFWSGDPMRSAVLSQKGCTMEYSSPSAASLPQDLMSEGSHYTMFSARMRVIIFNTNLLAASDRPTSVFDLTKKKYFGRGCIANPLFGTTAMHAVAVFQALGKAKAEQFFNLLTSNHVAMLSSNGEVRRRVAAGDFALGLTDSDDAHVAIRDGKPIDYVFPDQDGIGALMIPNAVSLIVDGPNQANGKKFIDFIVSPEVEILLAESEAAQWPLRTNLPSPVFFGRKLNQLKTMQIAPSQCAKQLAELNDGFLQEWVDRQNQRGK